MSVSGKPEETRLWDRRPGEPKRWFQRFERFRLKGPGRTIKAVWRDELGRDETRFKRAPTPRPSSRWYEMARLWQWQARAEAWDEFERSRLIAEVDRALAMLRAATPDAVVALIGALADARWRVTAAREILDRAGLPATTRQEIVDAPRSVRDLTDDELAAIAAGGLPARSSQ